MVLIKLMLLGIPQKKIKKKTVVNYYFNFTNKASVI